MFSISLSRGCLCNAETRWEWSNIEIGTMCIGLAWWCSMIPEATNRSCWCWGEGTAAASLILRVITPVARLLPPRRTGYIRWMAHGGRDIFEGGLGTVRGAGGWKNKRIEGKKGRRKKDEEKGEFVSIEDRSTNPLPPPQPWPRQPWPPKPWMWCGLFCFLRPNKWRDVGPSS